MKTKIILIWLMTFFLISCEDELTVAPESVGSSATFFTKESDFIQAVNGAYLPLRPIVNDRAFFLGEMHSDNAYYPRNPAFGATEQSEDIADFAIPAANGVTANVHVLNQYRLDYQIIARANNLLANIDKEIAGFPEASRNYVKGQALFLRAYAYFELVRYFGKVPMHLTPVPGRKEAALPLSSETELYAQIVQDAQQAVALLPLKSQRPALDLGRATSGAARTLLANVYMVQKKWAEAETLLMEVVASNEYSLMPEYTDAFSTSTGNKNNKESVFEVQFLEGSAGLNGTFLYNFLPRPITGAEVGSITGTSNAQSLTAEGMNTPTPDIIAAYEPGDKRKDASVGYVTLSQSTRANKVYPYIKKYARAHSLHNNHGMNWPIYRYSEVLLFLAEAMNEQGKDGSLYLNQVRTRAGLGAAAGDMREAIFNERRVELAFENKRWFDLVRTDRAVAVITAYGERIKANPADYYYPAGSAPRGHVFTNLSLTYALPADEAALTPHF